MAETGHVDRQLHRSTPGATSVTSVAAAPAPGVGTSVTTDCNFTPAAGERLGAPWRRTVSRVPRACSPSGGRSAGCCCGDLPAAAPARVAGASSRSSSRSDEADELPHPPRPPPSPSSPGRRVRRRRRPPAEPRPRSPGAGRGVVAAPDCPRVGRQTARLLGGAAATTAPMLVFVDADVRPGPTSSTGSPRRSPPKRRRHVGAAVAHGATPTSGLQLLFNVTALMGSGGFTVLGGRSPDGRLRAGAGNRPAPPTTRPAVTVMPTCGPASPRTSRSPDVSGAAACSPAARRQRSGCTRPGSASRSRGGPARWRRVSRDPVVGGVGVAAWVWSLAGGLFAGWPAYPLSAVQVWVLGRRAGTFGPLTAALYPLAVRRARRDRRPRRMEPRPGGTTWKGRAVDGGVTSSRILPTLALASIWRWASAMRRAGSADR